MMNIINPGSRTPLDKGVEINGYIVDELIGCGGSSLAYRMTKNNISYIVKELYPEKLTAITRNSSGEICVEPDTFNDYLNSAQNEYKTAKSIVRLKNGNNSTVLLPPIEQFEANNTIYTVLTNTNCLLLSELQTKIELPEFLYVFKLVLNAVASLHGDNVSNGLYSDWLPEDSEQAVNLLHLDIAPANIVFSLDNETIRAHVIDFNTSAILEKGEDGFLSNRAGFEVINYRRRYSHVNLIRAAKGINNIRITKQMDCYSLAVILFEYILNRPIESDDTENYNFCDGIKQQYPSFETDVVNQINDIFVKALVSEEYSTIVDLYSDVNRLYKMVCNQIQVQPPSKTDSFFVTQIKNDYIEVQNRITSQIKNEFYFEWKEINQLIIENLGELLAYTKDNNSMLSEANANIAQLMENSRVAHLKMIEQSSVESFNVDDAVMKSFENHNFEESESILIQKIKSKLCDKYYSELTSSCFVSNDDGNCSQLVSKNKEVKFVVSKDTVLNAFYLDEFFETTPTSESKVKCRIIPKQEYECANNCKKIIFSLEDIQSFEKDNSKFIFIIGKTTDNNIFINYAYYYENIYLCQKWNWLRLMNTHLVFLQSQRNNNQDGTYTQAKNKESKTYTANPNSDILWIDTDTLLPVLRQVNNKNSSTGVSIDLFEKKYIHFRPRIIASTEWNDYKIAKSYLYGIGNCEKNLMRAVEYFEKDGSPEAYYEISNILNDVFSLTEESIDYMVKSADGGFDVAKRAAFFELFENLENINNEAYLLKTIEFHQYLDSSGVFVYKTRSLDYLCNIYRKIFVYYSNKSCFDELKNYSELLFDACYQRYKSSISTSNLNILCNNILFISNEYKKHKRYDALIKFLLKTVDLLSSHCFDNKQKHVLKTRMKDIYYNLGKAYERLKEYDEAIRYIEKCFDYCEELDFKKTLENVWPTMYSLDLAEIHMKKGEYSNSEKYFLQALNTANDFETEREHFWDYQMHIYRGLGYIYTDMRKYEEAEKAYSQAVSVSLELLNEFRSSVLVKDYERILAETYNNFAWLYNVLGRYNEAIDLYLKSIEIKNKYSEEYIEPLARTFYNIAIAYENNLRSDEAKRYFVNALELYEKLPAENFERYSNRIDECKKHIETLS